jgi:hypothetical protein
MVGVPRVRLAGPERTAARLAVAVARPLSLLPPGRLCRVLRAVSRGARPATTAEAGLARTAVVSVSVRCAGHGCLQRSIATALLCRARGRWPDWCTGIRSRPFRAHAWVEAEGAAVGEPEDVSTYRTVLSVRARRPA